MQNVEQEAHQLVEQAKCRATKFRLKAAGGSIFDRFLNFEKCWPEAADDVISDIVVYQVSMNVHVKFSDSPLNNQNKHFKGVLRSAQAGPCLSSTWTCLCCVSPANYGRGKRCQIQQVIPNNSVQFRDHRLNCSRNICLDVVESFIFDSFFFTITSDQKELETSDRCGFRPDRYASSRKIRWF